MVQCLSMVLQKMKTFKLPTRVDYFVFLLAFGGKALIDCSRCIKNFSLLALAYCIPGPYHPSCIPKGKHQILFKENP